MTSHPNSMAWSYHWCVQPPTQRGEPVDFVLETVLEDARDATKGLVQHTREQHKKVLNFVPPRTHHHLRREDHGILTSLGTTKKRWNALSLCVR
jgi:hypothetical protein